jgi:hypothetical protein
MSDETDQLAQHAAESFDAGNPSAALAALQIALTVHPAPLHLPGKTVYGVWDPLLRRIELYACATTRPDADLVYTLGHELGHALHAARTYPQEPQPDAEPWSHRFAQAWLRRLGPDRIRTCADALRVQAAAPHPEPSASDRPQEPNLRSRAKNYPQGFRAPAESVSSTPEFTRCTEP